MAGSVLVVEGDVGFRRRIAISLSNLGLYVLEAFDFEEARRHLEGATLDVVILDIGLGATTASPGTQNADAERYELPNRIRARPREEYISIIVMSDEQYESAALNHGAVDFVRRDVTDAVLEAHVQRRLQLTRLIRRKPGTYGPERIGRPMLIASVFYLDQNRMLRVADGDVIKLTDREARVFSFMVVHPGKSLTKSDLERHLLEAEPFWEKNHRHYREISSEEAGSHWRPLEMALHSVIYARPLVLWEVAWCPSLRLALR